MRTTIVVVALMLWGTVAWAQEPKNADVKREPGEVYHLTREISNEVLSPFCPGKTLSMCSSYKAADVRRVIQDRAQEGLSKEEIKAEILKTYGDEFKLVEPPASDNLGLLAALIAGLVFAIGLVAVLSRRRDAEGKESTPTTSIEDWEDEYLDDIRDEISV